MSQVRGYVSKRRGYMALGAGVFLVVVSAGLYLFFANLAASGAMTLSPATATAFFGRLDVGFSLLAIAGMVGIGNGLWVVRRQKANVGLTVLSFLIAICSLGCFWQATTLLPPD